MTAKDLLLKILDYQCNWACNPFSEPAKIRMEQIEVLLDAYGLTKKYVNPSVNIEYSLVGEQESHNRTEHLHGLTNLAYFRSGEFLYDREENANTELFQKAMYAITPLYSGLPESISSMKSHDIKWLFSDLMNYREKIYELTYPWGGMLEGFSLGLSYSKHLQRQLNETIVANLTQIDDTLWLILDPEKREFTNEEINLKAVDLESIDREWRIANY